MIKKHDCGQKFWVEEKWNGLTWLEVIIGFEDENGDFVEIPKENRGAIACPCCGETVYPHSLTKEE
ncbi:MAG: hypothetical protein DRI22_00095 [Caldiserica bacterium]|nr:MAG: hypothetical protein DRI22_00095 [Caldisericota bacterium]